jgi:hypothetical protein
MLKQTIAALAAWIVTAGAASPPAPADGWPVRPMFASPVECRITVENDRSFYFSTAALERRLALAEGSLSGFTLTESPLHSLGLLTLDGRALFPYARLTRDEIDRIVYTPLARDTAARVAFIPEGSREAAAVLTMAHSDSPGSSPTLSAYAGPGLMGLPIQGWARIEDPDGDASRLRIVTQPAHGTVRIEGRRFIYTPSGSRTRSDRFVLRAVDQAGHLSEDVAVTLSVEKWPEGCDFEDIASSPFAYCIARCAASGLMRGEQIGERRLFSPEKPVTAGELAVMLLAVRGLDGTLPSPVNTGLQNDADIPLWLKPYIRKAMEADIITGAYFDADAVPSRAQAVAMAARAAGLPPEASEVLVLSDSADIPVWAAACYDSLWRQGLLWTPDGHAEAQLPLDRQYAAALLWPLAQRGPAS